jgi:hypothetical protein
MAIEFDLKSRSKSDSIEVFCYFAIARFLNFPEALTASSKLGEKIDLNISLTSETPLFLRCL